MSPASRPSPSAPASRPPAIQGALDALSFAAWVLGLSLLGVGSLAKDVGFPAGAAVLATVLMWAGPAQVIFFAGMGAGLAWPAIAIAVTLSSIRLLPMAMTILPLLRPGANTLARQIFAAHYIAVTLWVEGARRLPPLPAEQRWPYFLGFANACLVVCTITTFIGFHLVGALPLPLAAGLLFLTPIFFTLSMSAGAKGLADWLALGFGFALAPVFTAVLGKDLDLLGTGLVGGTAAYAIGRWRRRR